MFTWIILSCILLLCWILYSDHHQRYFPPGAKRLPFIGHLWSLMELRRLPLHLRFDEFLKQHGPIVGLQHIGKNMIIIGDYALAKAAFRKNNLASRNNNGYFFKLSSGKGFEPAHRPMGVFGGTHWKDHRTFFLNHFKNASYGKNNFEINVHRELNDLIEIISNQHEGILCINVDTFAITTINVIWKIVAGIRFSHSDPDIKQMILNLRKLMKIVFNRGLLWDIAWINKMFPKLTQIDLLVNVLDSLKKQITCEIINHKKYINVGTPNDFMESFLQAAQQNDQNSEFYSENELLIVCLELFTGGFHTTTSTLQWTILMMVLHPSIQYKVHEEIKNNVDDNELLTMAHRPMLPYTNAVLSEVYRFGSIAHFNPPHIATENVTLLDFVIPKGSLVLANLYTIHHESGYWHDPQSFIPERFLSKDGIYKNNENLVPFGVGKRKCLAEDLAQSELFMIFGSLIKRFQFALPAEHLKPSLDRQEGVTCEPFPFSVIVTDLSK